MLESKPRIFVSSTIYDFADLRSALKYWLNEMGFEVYMSEYTDFRKDSTDNSYKACLNAIQECDYYILLIGARVGGLFSENPKVSITQKEYQEASKLFDDGKIKKMFTFVRKDIWTIREDRKALHQILKNNYLKDNELSKDDIKQIESHESTFINDADLIFHFIKEVGKVQQMKDAVIGNADLPTNNWINTFYSFEDIITVLKTELNIHTDLSYKRWGEIVVQEISHNLAHLTQKTDGKLYPFYALASNYYKAFPDKIDTDFTVSKKDSLGAYLFIIKSCMHIDRLNSEMTKGAIQSGVFLQYDKNNQDFRSRNIQKALYALVDNIVLVKRAYDIMQRNEYLAHLKTILKIDHREFVVHNSGDLNIVWLIALYNSEFNVIELSRYLFAVLKTGYDANEYPDLKSTLVFKKDENNEPITNDITPEDIYNYFVNNKQSTAAPEGTAVDPQI